MNQDDLEKMKAIEAFSKRTGFIYFDREGNGIDLLEWAHLMKNEDYRIVEQEYVGNYFVSTIWLGLDHNIFDNRILIFETMVFGKNKNLKEFSPKGLFMERYSTEEEAIGGHHYVVKQLKKGKLELYDWEDI